MVSVYIPRVKSVSEDASTEVKERYKPGTWLRVYINTYTGKSFLPVPHISNATIYDNPELDGLEKKWNDRSLIEIEAVEFVEKGA